ncbi:MAG: tyrosine-type recombinase/integrase [Bacteroidetes bacterium]|nr:tyrosine-type recombinase/integrase [Bacteroidota bacterium]
MKYIKELGLFAFIGVLGCGCGTEPASEDIVVTQPESEEFKLFTLLKPSQTNIGFVNIIEENEKTSFYSFDYMYNGSGVAIGDLNNDGLPELYFNGSQSDNQLYLNNGNFEFENITQKAGERAEIKNPNPRLQHINPHIFRHSIARFLKSKNLSAEWIQNFLGHASFKTTMDMYGTISINEMQEDVEKKLSVI